VKAVAQAGVKNVLFLVSPKLVPPALPAHFAYGPLPESLARSLPERALAQLRLYNPLTDTERLRANPDQFEALRGNYPLRRENED